MLTKQEGMITIQTVRRGIPVPLFSPNGGDVDFDEEDLPEEYDDEDENGDGEGGPETAEMMMEGRLVVKDRPHRPGRAEDLRRSAGHRRTPPYGGLPRRS